MLYCRREVRSMQRVNREIKSRSEKARKNSTTMGLMMIPLLLFFYAQLFPTGARSAVTFSPQSYLENRFESVKPGFQTEEFQLYTVQEEQGEVLYAFVKRIGAWVQDSPHPRNTVGVTFGKESVYYYGSFRRAAQAVGEDGTVYLPSGAGDGQVYLLPLPKSRHVYDFGEGHVLVLQARTQAYEQTGSTSAEPCE